GLFGLLYQQIAELFTKATTKIGSSMIIKAWRFLLYQGIMLIIQVRNLSYIKSQYDKNLSTLSVSTS
ncbi:hypothetical protein, partial [Heyndrickxia coagulans]|uniref:hypothetical protein n=1 Tax=Heyndrickxia coagulans TaxID=1398 RepID=UPI001F1D4E10